MSGGFVLTYTIQAGSRKYAVRCFHKEVPQVESRYSQIATKLRSLASPYFVNFDFEPNGIRIHGKSFPIVKMDWVEGETLGLYLDRWSSSPPALAALRRSFSSLAEYLERNSVAHGDIQNENIIVSGSAPRLIDYDGMYVSGMPEGQGTEVGQKNFQHPGRTTRQFGPRMDRFSFIVLDVSLEAMQADAALHRRFREGGQAIIFKANDFADPSSSEIFRILNGMPVLRQSAVKFAAVCAAAIESVPTLADFNAGRNIPTAVAPPIGAPPKVAVVPTYIGAFPVVDAKDFSAVLRCVGDKIELVGQIVSVKQGTGKRGRGRGRPYVFINFGVWNADSTKITIWSEGLGNLNSRPTGAWAGNWISVTGLVEPPYEGKHYGRPYRNVGITVVADNQIIQISEQNAKFRLGRNAQRVATGSTGTRNADILGGIRGGKSRTETHAGGSIAKTSPQLLPAKTRNEQILRGLQTAAGQSNGGPRYSSPTSQGSHSGLLSRIPIWVWIGGAILLFIMLSGRH